ncbi:DUF523 domain-containing protein [Sinorhizobium meliloti]|nr:DUF523 domain-containing protein [Sinorhizobium meliloti]
MTARILVSACLMGHAVRYDGARSRSFTRRSIAGGRKGGSSPSVRKCRPASGAASAGRDRRGQDGRRRARRQDARPRKTGGDVTSEFRRAAENALALARETNCRFALLIDGSPSCGSRFIYDGRFSGERIAVRA